MNEENIPQSFHMRYTLHRPWSDILFETTLPPMVLEKMIKISDEVLADSKRIQYGDNLAGQVKEESSIISKPFAYFILVDTGFNNAVFISFLQETETIRNSTDKTFRKRNFIKYN